MKSDRFISREKRRLQSILDCSEPSSFFILASIILVNSPKRSSYEWLRSHILSSHFCDCSQTNSCSLPDIIHSIIYRALEHPLLHAYRDVILREQHTRKAITLNACIQNIEHAFFTGNKAFFREKSCF